MLAVTTYSVFLKKWNYQGIEQKGYEMIFANSTNTTTFLLGNAIAFIVALFAIKFFIEIIKKYGFKIWGWYRIIVGIILMITISLGWI